MAYNEGDHSAVAAAVSERATEKSSVDFYIMGSSINV